MSTLLLIDFHNTVMRSLSVHKFLVWEGEYTGGIYGVFGQLVGIIHRHKPDAILNCTDAKPYLREKLYPGFKGDRKKKTYKEEEGFDFYEALNQNISSTLKLLDTLNIPTWKIAGLEADDLIASASLYYKDQYDKIIILSNDTDLNQLLVHLNIFMYKKQKLYGCKEFQKEFPIDPDQWVDYTAMVGTHNGVPGIKGIGRKTAAKVLHDEELFKQCYAKHESEFLEKRALIKLPFPEYEKNMRVMSPKRPNGNYREIASFLSNYGIDFSGYDREAFEDY